MKNFNEKYSQRRFINKNEFMETYMAINSITKDKVILKVFNKKVDKEEIKLLKDIESPNLIDINNFGSFIENNEERYYVEVENFQSKSLSEILNIRTVSSVEGAKILKQVAEGLKEFHFKSLVFGNLSCDCIYVNEQGMAKIDTLHYIGISDEDLYEEDDMYSLGAILFELVTGENNFKPEKSKQYISDKDLLLIINRCTNEKYRIYEDLNKFIEDLNSYIEYGGISSNINEEYEVYDEFENDENYSKFNFIKLIRNIMVCAIVAVLIGVGVNVSGLLNKEEKDTTSQAPKVDEMEATDDEETEKQEILDDEEEEEVQNDDITDNEKNEEDEYEEEQTTVNKPYTDMVSTTTSNNSSMNNNTTTTKPNTTVRPNNSTTTKPNTTARPSNTTTTKPNVTVKPSNNTTIKPSTGTNNSSTSNDNTTDSTTSSDSSNNTEDNVQLPTDNETTTDDENIDDQTSQQNI